MTQYTRGQIQIETGENGYPICESCDQEIIWGENSVIHCDQIRHEKCWDEFCLGYYT